MYRVEIANNAGYQFMAKSKDGEFSIDVKGAGPAGTQSGGGAGMTPPDVLLASLGSCVGVYIRKYAEGAKLELGAFNVTVEADLSKEAPHLFKKINVAIGLGDLELDDRRKAALLDFIRNCPVHNTLKGSPQIDLALT